MGFRIIIAGEAQCFAYAETVLLADYLSQQLPNFAYNCIQKSVRDWKSWLCKVNMKNKWHHTESPIVWKELLMKGSQPHYIGGASEFLDYCYSYYNFDALFASEKYEGLLDNILQFKRKVHLENVLLDLAINKNPVNKPPKNSFVVTISGARHLLTMHLISGLLAPEYTRGDKIINKIYLYDDCCSKTFMNYVEKECSYVRTDTPGRVVKYVEKIGIALTSTDMLIILDHEPFDEKKPIGQWLRENRKKMEDLALMINASGPRNLNVIFPNLGPACYNATILRNHVNIDKSNIVVATSDLGMEILPIVAKIAEVPMRNIFCPPVWGFVGINQLVDVRTTVHQYNSFEPYRRYTRVKNSTLNIGSMTPEMRTLYYLMHFDVNLWTKVVEMKEFLSSRPEWICARLMAIGSAPLLYGTKHNWRIEGVHAKKMSSKGPAAEERLNKAKAVISLVNLWLLNPSADHIICLGISCNGSFGLHFDGIFSQPARFVNGRWKSATDFLMPLDREMKLPYLEKMAELVMHLGPDDLPPIKPYYPCGCKQKVFSIN